MKKTALLKHLREHGCKFVREAGSIRGGSIQNRTNTHPFQGIQRLKISLLERYAKIWEYHF